MWFIGVANRKHTICSACEPCYVNTSKFFAIFDCLVMLTDYSDAEMLGLAIFVPTDNRQQTMTDMRAGNYQLGGVTDSGDCGGY